MFPQRVTFQDPSALRVSTRDGRGGWREGCVGYLHKHLLLWFECDVPDVVMMQFEFLSLFLAFEKLENLHDLKLVHYEGSRTGPRVLEALQ